MSTEQHDAEKPMRREHDSVDDFEHLDVQESNTASQGNRGDPKKLQEEEFIKKESMQVVEDVKKASQMFMEAEKEVRADERLLDLVSDLPKPRTLNQSEAPLQESQDKESMPQRIIEEKPQEIGVVRSSVLPVPEKSPTVDFLGDVAKGRVAESWNVIEGDLPPPMKPLPPTPKDKPEQQDKSETLEMSNDFVLAEAPKKEQISGTETGDSEFESEVEASPVKVNKEKRIERVEDVEIAPKEIFKSIGIDAWFNPERLNPRVAALIYWRDPKKSGAVFGAILGVLLSLAYFSLISVLAYLSLLLLAGTVTFRIYKTVLQAVQKTSDGHPFKDILDLDLKVPAERVHEVADVAVAHANAAVTELRRLFLVEDFVDSLKFGVLLWCLTYLGSWFNGMTLIIIGVVALFTLPKVYETNKAQIDQNLALVHGKINELTAKVKAAIPLGKKPEPLKEE